MTLAHNVEATAAIDLYHIYQDAPRGSQDAIVDFVKVFLGIPRCTFSGIARILGGSITSFYGPETPLSVVEFR